MSLLWAAALWVSAYYVGHSRLTLQEDDAWTYAGLLFFAEAVVATMALGLLGWLRPLPLHVLCCAFLAAHLWLASSGRLSTPRHTSADKNGWLMVTTAAACAVIGLRLLLALIIPPDSWDGLSYHLPIAVRWLQQGNLDLSGWYGAERYYAWNGELLSAWLAVLDGGSLLFAKISQAFVLPLLAGAGASLGRRLAGRRWAGACSLALAAAPIAVIQAGVPYVDLLHSAFFIAAAAAGTACLRSERRVHLIAGAVAFGLNLGAKSTIYFSALLLAAPALAYLFRPQGRMRMLRILPACAIIVVVLGLSPYLRNWTQTSNPIFPFDIKVLGRTIFSGPLSTADLLVSMEKWFVSAPQQWLWYPLHERIKGLADYTYENGFGPLCAAGWILWPLAFALAWRRRDRAAISFLGLLPAATFFFMVLQPVRTPRYILFASSIPIIAGAYALRRARGLQLGVARGLWTAGLAWGLLGVLAYLGQSDGPREAWGALRSGKPLSEAQYYRRVFFSLGEAWTELNENIQPGDIVSVNYAELLLPWSGFPPRARALVLHSQMTDYPQAYFAVTGDDWMGMLEKLGVRYVVVWSPRWSPKEGERERAWIAEHPARFHLFGHWESTQMGRTDIYELVKP